MGRIIQARLPYVPSYSREQQLHFCWQLGLEIRRWYRYDPEDYAEMRRDLRHLYRAIRDGVPLRSWTMEDVETALGERGLGPKPMSEKPNCSCVPFPGSWTPDTRAVDSHWHDRAVRWCMTCGEKRVRWIPKSIVAWPSSYALRVEIYGSDPDKWPQDEPF